MVFVYSGICMSTHWNWSLQGCFVLLEIIPTMNWTCTRHPAASLISYLSVLLHPGPVPAHRQRISCVGLSGPGHPQGSLIPTCYSWASSSFTLLPSNIGFNGLLNTAFLGSMLTISLWAQRICIQSNILGYCSSLSKLLRWEGATGSYLPAAKKSWSAHWNILSFTEVEEVCLECACFPLAWQVLHHRISIKREHLF